MIDGIGSTEMLHIFLSNRPGDVAGTTGKPWGYEIELRGDDGQPVADGEIGDLYIQGAERSVAVLGQPGEDLRDVSRRVDEERRQVCRDGSCYTYAGRSDDMLKVSGQYVSPFEVEGTLVQHPAVLEAAVVGVPDANGLTRTKAFVVLKPGRDASDALSHELQTFIKERLAPHKYPRAIEFIDELPKTATGKIQRFRLREREGARARDEGRSRRRPVRRHRLGGSTGPIEYCRSHTSNGSRPPPARRVPARGLGSLAMWKRLPARAVRCSERARSGVFPTRLWPVDAASARKNAGTSTTSIARRGSCSPAFFAALGLDTSAPPPWLLGHSDGGSIALLYASRFPRSVGGLDAARPIFSSSRSA